ncbi:MAG TPA: ribosome maturation factor RimM, partial [Dongiaceae bacterium]|nr:ribosome maturation factor RimM [Dongiaceae bacterium]
MSLVLIGTFGRPHGVRGEIYLDRAALTADELERLRRARVRDRAGAERDVTLRAVRPAHDRLLVTLEGYTTREAVAALTLGELWAEETALPDPGPGVAYTHQLIGLTVEDPTGRVIGTLKDVTGGGAQPLYVIAAPDGRELLVPGVPEMLRHVDLTAGRITV